MAMVGWDVPNYHRIRTYTRGQRLLMLGNQTWGPNVLRLSLGREPTEQERAQPAQTLFLCSDYCTLDLDGGDLQRDLEQDLSDQDQAWGVVFNLGTLEHCWDVHRAYSNAARMVRLGGHYLGHAPVEGFANHGIQITHWGAIERFFQLNGFDLVDGWRQDRGAGSTIHWLVAEKCQHLTEFRSPKQIWQGGQDCGIA